MSETITRSENGQLSILLEKPEPGNWTIEIEYGSKASAEIHASSLRRGWRDKLLKGTRWFGCKTCKLALRAFIILIILHIGPLVSAGVAAHGLIDVLQKTAPILLDIIVQTLGLDGGALPHFFSVVVDYIDTPIDGLLEWTCTSIGLCRP